MAAALLGSICSASWAAGAAVPEAPELDELLAELDRSAQRYRNHALRFTCDETVTHYVSSGKDVYRSRYVYRYDESDGLSDYRVPMRKGDKEIKSRKKQQRTLDAVVLSDVYSWIFLFSTTRRHLHRFELGDAGAVDGRFAVAVRFAPREPVQKDVNDWYGTAWVDLERYELLRVEALKVDGFRKKQRFEDSLRSAARKTGRHRSSHVIEQYVTEYSVEREGLRFPSQATVRVSRYDVWGGRGSSGYREQPIFRIKQSYDNYRFFGVDCREEVDGWSAVGESKRRR